MFGTLIQAARAALVKRPAVNVLLHTRNKMKSHKAVAKRFIKTGTGIKRKQAGRNHGNGGFSSNSLSHLDPFVKVTAKGNHLKKITRSLQC